MNVYLTYMKEQFIIYLIFNCTYYASSFLLLFLDLFVPSVIYKIHNISYHDLIKIYYKVFPRVFLNVSIISIPCILMISYLINIRQKEFSYFDLIWQIIFFSYFVDFTFYIVHYSLHYPPLYKWSHKIHHEITIPIGLAALYNHWFDYILSALISTYLGAIIVSAHIYTVYLWILLSTLITVIHSHGGIRKFSEFHDLHHQKNNVNYGAGTLVDKLFGTYHES